MSLFNNHSLSVTGQQYFDMGKLSFDRKDYASAIKYFNKALETDADNKQVVQLLEQTNKLLQQQLQELDASSPQVLYTTELLTASVIDWYAKKGYAVATLVFAKSKWIVVLKRQSQSQVKQYLFTAEDIPEQKIANAWNEGYYISASAYGDNKWAIVMLLSQTPIAQQWFTNQVFPDEKIEEGYVNGLQVSGCVFGDRWFCVMQDKVEFINQQYHFTKTYPDKSKSAKKAKGSERFVTHVHFDAERIIWFDAESDNLIEQQVVKRQQLPIAVINKLADDAEFYVTAINYIENNWYITCTKVCGDKPVKKFTEKEAEALTVEQATAQLNQLIGLRQAKEEINNLIGLVKLNKIKKQRGFPVTSVSLHAVFTGNPGTGKTTVARIYAQILKSIGIISKGHLIEADRSALVAEYVGQTAVKTNQLIDKALGGVLFIDEAYSLSQGNNDFGIEAIATLLKRMEDERDKLVVIVAGYTNEMKSFIHSNPGLESRFSTGIHFDDYTVDELMDIFRNMVIDAGHQLHASADAFTFSYFKSIYAIKDKQFGNARVARNLLEDVIKSQSARLSNASENPSDEELITLLKQDVEQAVKDVYTEEKELTVNDILQELDKLTGLCNIKSEIKNLHDYISVTNLRKLKGLPVKQLSLHSIFYGAPGTGKTTVARLMGKMFKALGILGKGHVVEVSRKDLVAAYVGQTAIKTSNKIDEAINGILFIDEAYSLSNKGGSNDFGSEAIEVLLKRMEDERDKLVVILAGYSDLMKDFIESNPGLQSRFNRYFNFQNYTAAELLDIIEKLFVADEFIKEAEVTDMLVDYFALLIQNADEHFGNAREARNLFELIKVAQAKRLSKSVDAESQLSLIKKSDISDAIQMHKLQHMH